MLENRVGEGRAVMCIWNLFKVNFRCLLLRYPINNAHVKVVGSSKCPLENSLSCSYVDFMYLERVSITRMLIYKGFSNEMDIFLRRYHYQLSIINCYPAGWQQKWFKEFLFQFEYMLRTCQRLALKRHGPIGNKELAKEKYTKFLNFSNTVCFRLNWANGNCKGSSHTHPKS